ncbi:MAG TPA: alpha/beta hydrolase [Solirubrobacteraceae bacterium]|nr:alpha/beta hydrolase [Solirubrobacteraceae bacterium]
MSASDTGHQTGANLPALLLHGQPGSARDWTLVEDAVGERLKTIAIDRPGWDGRSEPGGLEPSGRAAVAALDGAGAARAVVVGLSFGAAVATWVAAEHPERVAALVLVSPAANTASLQPVDRLLALPGVGYAASAGVLAGAGLALASGRVRQRLERTFALPDDYLRTASRRLRRPAAWTAFVVEQRALLEELPRLEERLSEITAPTTVVVGTADTVVPLEASRQLSRQIPAAKLVEIPGGHHVLPAEHPARLAELILAAAGPGGVYSSASSRSSTSRSS